MRYINEKDMRKIGIDWHETIAVIEDAVHALDENLYAQPVKPYLKYGNPKNRIIAMPAYVGGKFDMAGIKWIASFPDNIVNTTKPRAHSIVVLNDSSTGEPVGIINTALLSIIRTASVSGLVMKKYMEWKERNNIKVGIIGFGPIGKYHLLMCKEILGDKVSDFYLYDELPVIDMEDEVIQNDQRVHICENYEQVYSEADIFITCTVAGTPYIGEKPKDGSLILNVSLRDFKTDMFQYVKDTMIVDNWTEVCRENTNIEAYHKSCGLKEEDVQTIADITCRDGLNQYSHEDCIMFHPMGMAIFDVAISSYYLKNAITNQIGLELD